MVYSSGFSFANYDYIIISKPDGENTATALYGLDVEFGNLMSRYNMKVIGDKEFLTIDEAAQKRTLFARLSLVANGAQSLVTVSFDDAVTGKTGASITSQKKGDIFNNKERSKVMESLYETLVTALERDKGLTISDHGSKSKNDSAEVSVD